MYELRLTVLSPGGELLDEERVDWVRVQLVDGGGIGIWPGHAPLIAETITAPLAYSRDGKEERIDLQRGILQIEIGRVVILTGGEAEVPRGEGRIEVREERFDRLAQSLLARLREERREGARESGG